MHTPSPPHAITPARTCSRLTSSSISMIVGFSLSRSRADLVASRKTRRRMF